MTQVIEASHISLLVDALNQGEIVAFPTETVFGLACRFNDHEALQKLMAVKERDVSKAVTLMVAYKEDIGQYAYVDEKIQRVIDAFMPGRITLVLKKKDHIDPFMTGGRDTIGIRIPDSPFVLSLLETAGELLVTSANIAGGKNTTNEREVLAQLDGRIAYVVKGKTKSAQASTVVDLTGERPVLLRQGAISLKEIEGVFNEGSSRM